MKTMFGKRVPDCRKKPKNESKEIRTQKRDNGFTIDLYDDGNMLVNIHTHVKMILFAIKQRFFLSIATKVTAQCYYLRQLKQRMI